MPRPRKPARLYLRPDTDEWVIRDGPIQRGTGARGSDGRSAAERALARYLAERETCAPRPADRLTVGAVLAAYARDRGPELVPRGRDVLAACIKALAPFWGDLLCSEVIGSTCRRYARERDRKPATVRREMGVLQAALRHAHREGLLTTPVVATMPPAGQPRDRWLTRSEAARLLCAAAPHVRRFILVALYTGTRASAILALRWSPSLTSGWVDLERGVLHRKGAREVETKKRRGAVRMPRQLLAHMRRWSQAGGSHVVSWHGRGIETIDDAFRAAVARAGIERCTPHDLKRTAVSWAFQRGMSREDAADYFDTTAATLEAVYRAYSPEHQARAVKVMEGRKL